MSLVTMTRPDGSTVQVESNDAVLVHGVDARGAYLGLVSPEQATNIAAGGPPSGDGWLWSSQGWRRELTLAVLKVTALERIDAAAGAARLRYITDVPGQAATYAMKDEQARAFVADPALTPVPPMVQAEADVTGQTPLEAAQYIMATADAWIALAPLIELERRKGKCQVEQAATAEQVQASAQAAIDTLAAI